jgi:hypothetical protein
MTEIHVPDEETELTVQDILDDAGQAPYHTILEVWREVLRPAERERYKKITPQWANRIVATYREIAYQDVPIFRDAYFDKIAQLQEILDNEIASDDECLNQTSPEEDVEYNSNHYLNILIDWQKAFLYWELAWDCTDQYAPMELAAISEIHRMIFDNTGLTSLLDNIQFQFTEDDQTMLVAVLQDIRDSQEGQ